MIFSHNWDIFKLHRKLHNSKKKQLRILTFLSCICAEALEVMTVCIRKINGNSFVWIGTITEYWRYYKIPQLPATIIYLSVTTIISIWQYPVMCVGVVMIFIVPINVSTVKTWMCIQILIPIFCQRESMFEIQYIPLGSKPMIHATTRT